MLITKTLFQPDAAKIEKSVLRKLESNETLDIRVYRLNGLFLQFQSQNNTGNNLIYPAVLVIWFVKKSD